MFLVRYALPVCFALVGLMIILSNQYFAKKTYNLHQEFASTQETLMLKDLAALHKADSAKMVLLSIQQITKQFISTGKVENPITIIFYYPKRIPMQVHLNHPLYWGEFKLTAKEAKKYKHLNLKLKRIE